MRRQLRLHPDSHSAAVTGIDVEVALPRADRLELSYIVSGEMSRIRMPAAATNARSDGLWRHTCFEAFVRTSSGAGYYELNFSPSGQWATYQFNGYRSGMRVADETPGIAIALRSSPGGCTLQASLDPSRFSELPPDRPWRLGLSAVIEDTNGGLSYWALAHAPGKPDFHHADNFTCEISPTVTP
jgi:hypothetical protein